jgi:hypothetical protein
MACCSPFEDGACEQFAPKARREAIRIEVAGTKLFGGMEDYIA